MLDRKTDDPQDIRRVEGIDRAYQPKTKRKATVPNVKTVEELQFVVYDDSGTKKLCIRSNGKLYAVTLTEI